MEFLFIDKEDEISMSFFDSLMGFYSYNWICLLGFQSYMELFNKAKKVNYLNGHDVRKS